MGKKVTEQKEASKVHKNSKAERFDEAPEVVDEDKHTWPANAVVYIGHLPHGFQEEQLTSYLSQYGEVMAVKLARSRLTARSKGYAFIQFRYPEVAEIVGDTMNGYLLLGKVLVSNTLASTQKNPFIFSSSGKYKYINWKRIFIKQSKQPKTDVQVAHLVHNMIKNEGKKRVKFAELGIKYEFPGFASFVPHEEPKPKSKGAKATKAAKGAKPAKKTPKAK